MSLDPEFLQYPRMRHGMDHDRYAWSMLADRPPATTSYRLRAVVDYGYADAFPMLRQSVQQDTYLSEAAE